MSSAHWSARDRGNNTNAVLLSFCLSALRTRINHVLSSSRIISIANNIASLPLSTNSDHPINALLLSTTRHLRNPINDPHDIKLKLALTIDLEQP